MLKPVLKHVNAFINPGEKVRLFGLITGYQIQNDLGYCSYRMTGLHQNITIHIKNFLYNSIYKSYIGDFTNIVFSYEYSQPKWILSYNEMLWYYWNREKRFHIQLELKWHVNEMVSSSSPSWRFCHNSVYFLMSLPSKGSLFHKSHHFDQTHASVIQYIFEPCIKHFPCSAGNIIYTKTFLVYNNSLENERLWLYKDSTW